MKAYALKEDGNEPGTEQRLVTIAGFTDPEDQAGCRIKLYPVQPPL
jgi:hypothetical protein